MSTSIRTLSGLVLSAVGLTLGASAQAQSGTASPMGTRMEPSSSWSANAEGGYIGFNAGRSDYRRTNGKGDAYSVYAGRLWGENFGLEIGATDFGNSNSRDAYGFNLSAVGRVPLTPAFALVGKLGGLYSRTETAGVKDSGWGETYGLGVDFNFTQNLTGVVQYDRSRLPFAGEKEHINVTMVGLKYRY